MKSSIWLVGLFAMVFSAVVSAEVIEIPEEGTAEPEVISPDAPAPEMAPEDNAVNPVIDQPVSVTVPGRGMLKDQVEERFGAPLEKVPAVGEPPISSWVYNGFTVYFEYDHVIHSVRHR